MKTLNRILFAAGALIPMLSLAPVSRAQDVPERLQALFTPAVSIVNYTLYPDPAAVRIRYNNVERVLWIDDQSIVFPEDILSIQHHQTFNDEVVFQVSEQLPDLPGAGERTRSWLWMLDTAPAALTRYQPLCGQALTLSLIDLGQPWVYVTDPASGHTRLCNTEPGTTSDPLPADLARRPADHFTGAPVPVETSPDGEWLLLFGMTAVDSRVYSYSTTDGYLRLLGAVPCSDCFIPWSVRWFGSHVLIEAWDGFTFSVYSARAGNTDSLQPEFTRAAYQPDFFADPPRYDFMTYRTAQNPWQIECQRITYDVLSDQLEVTEMGPLCRAEFGTVSEVGYYRDTSRGAEGLALLTRFNALTSERTVLFEGEIEWIEWISEDERYAVVVLDSNGQVDTPPHHAASQWDVPEAPRLAYIDLTNGRMLFDIVTGWWVCDLPLGGPDLSWNAHLSTTAVQPCETTGPTGAIFARGNHTFLAVGNELNGVTSPVNQGAGVAEIIVMDGDTVTRTQPFRGDLIPYDQNHILNRSWNSTASAVHYELVEAETWEPMRLTTEVELDRYDIRITHVYPGTSELRMSIYRNDDNEVGWSSAEVMLRINASSG